jgi:hypothetical protein
MMRGINSLSQAGSERGKFLSGRVFFDKIKGSGTFLAPIFSRERKWDTVSRHRMERKAAMAGLYWYSRKERALERDTPSFITQWAV